MATLLPEGKQSFTDGAGMPLVGGKLYTYDAGTSTPRPTYSDAAATTPNTNPVVLDARGEATVFWKGAYKVVLKDSAGTTVWTVDNVDTPVSSTELASSASGKGAEIVGVSLVGGAPTTVKAVLQAHDTKLQNLDTALNFSTLPVASSPVADTDLMVLRQGGANKQLPVSVVRAEFATNAVAAAAAATAAKDGAVVAKTAAEAARDATVVGAAPTVYATTAAGLAATTSGKYFSVPSADSAEYLILYLNSSGSAVEVKRYTAAAALDPLQKTNSIFAVEDADGNLGMSVESPFRVAPNGAVETSSHDTSKQVHRYRWAVADADGNITVGVNESGQLVADFSLAPIPTSAYKTGGTYDYEVNQVFTYGQSLSVGQATPAISTTQKYDNVMFYRGMRPQYDYPSEAASQWYASLQPAIEAQSPTQPALAETPSMGTGDAIKERILAEDGLSHTGMKYQIALSAPGYGATSIAQLSKGTAHYNRLIEQAQYGLSLSNAAGKTYAVQAVTWTQGESDISNSQANYYSAMNALVADLNADLKAVTGQTKSIPLISYQIAAHGGGAPPNIALAQLQAETDNPLIYIACPMYHFQYQDHNNPHLTNVSSRWLGAYYGLAYKRIVIDKLDWKPLKPISSNKQSTVAVVKFNVPSGRLVFDTTLVAENTNYGFELVDSGGSPLAISSVSIMGPDTVKIVASATIPAGAKLRYAWTGAGAYNGSVYGPRGNLRDTQGDTIVFDPAGINKPMHNWCVIFELSI